MPSAGFLDPTFDGDGVVNHQARPGRLTSAVTSNVPPVGADLFNLGRVTKKKV